jgi:alkylation response protein AidB-like acyl-CoA dehydrogenase
VDVTARLAPVLRVAAQHARDVDAAGRYPDEAVQALRESGLLGLTVPADTGQPLF